METLDSAVVFFQGFCFADTYRMNYKSVNLAIRGLGEDRNSIEIVPEMIFRLKPLDCVVSG